MTTRRQPIRIGTRGSALALAQAALVAAAFEAERRPHRIVVVETAGDRRAPDTAWGEGAFVAAIERALLEDRVDVAVHSAKDVPTDEDPRLRIGAYLPRADPRDALVAPLGGGPLSLDSLAPGAIVGTDSPRRSAFVRARRPDVVVRPLHGNVDTRLRRLDAGEADVLVLAVAGLARLGRDDRISGVLDPDVVPPAPGQGAIAVQIRASDAPLIAVTAAIDDRRTRLAVEAERAFLRACGGGCRSPIGALATTDGERIRLLGGVATEGAPNTATGTAEGDAVHASAVARDLASRLLGDLAAIGAAGANGGRPVVLITRPVGASDPLAAALVRRGVDPVIVPAIAIEALGASDDLDRSIRPLADDDWIVVTSANGVAALVPLLERVGIRIGAPRWAAVGNATATALRDAGAEHVWLPSRADAATLAGELPVTAGMSIGVVRGSLGDQDLGDRLAARGAVVHEAIVYETREGPAGSRPLLELALKRGPAAIVIASPSAARGLLSLADGGAERLLALPAVCIGPRTAEAARQLGYAVAAVAARPGPAAIADLVADVTARPAPVLT